MELTMLFWALIIIGIVIYIGIAAACAMVFEAIGERDNPKYGSWTGDYGMDFWSVVFWPLTVVIMFGIAAGRSLARAVVHG